MSALTKKSMHHTSLSPRFRACLACADGRRANLAAFKQQQDESYTELSSPFLDESEVQSSMDALATYLLAVTPHVRQLPSRGLSGISAVPRSFVASMQTANAEETQETSGTEKKKVKRKSPVQKVKAPAQTSIEVERVFWEGPPSITETLIPGLSVFTVIGIIPFGASIARQAWTRYTISNRRFTVQSGFQGKDEVQFVWREVEGLNWLRRFGGAAGDLVVSLRDGSKVEIRSIPDFERNFAFIMSQIPEDAKAQFSQPYPDGPAKDYFAKVESGELPPPTIESLDASSD